MEGLSNAVAERLVTLRHSANMTQEDFAKKLGYSTNTIAAYECGRRRPTVETIDTIIRAFGISPEYFIGPVPGLDEMDENRREIIRNIFLILQLMPEDDLERILKHLQIESEGTMVMSVGDVKDHSQ